MSVDGEHTHAGLSRGVRGSGAAEEDIFSA